MIIGAFSVLQVARWRILPQFMDIYYHLLTGWGFLKAGGWSSWDFWQYAPVGRPHIYPPFFHLVIALLLKIGLSPVVLAKSFETLAPILFLVVLRRFIAKNYTSRLAFFALLAAVSSFSFYMNLINHIPAALAMIFCLFCLQQLLRGKWLAAGLLLALSFYTHIGISWFFAIAIMLWGSLFNRQDKRLCFKLIILALILASPFLLYQLFRLKAISAIGLNLSERNAIQFKPLEYILAAYAAFFIIRKMPRDYRLFPALFCASFIFLLYPYRFFSAEGYLPVILLSAVSLDYFYSRLDKAREYVKRVFIASSAFIFLIVSPAILNHKFSLGHSAFMGMVNPMDEGRGFMNSIWFKRDYLSAADFIRRNSGPEGIIYSNYDILGVCLASLSQRRTSNALFPEIKAAGPFDPLAGAILAVISKDEEGARLIPELEKRGFFKAGEERLFIFYAKKNP